MKKRQQYWKGSECWHAIKKLFQPTIPDSQGQVSSNTKLQGLVYYWRWL